MTAALPPDPIGCAAAGGPVTVVVVDDSSVQRRFVRTVIDEDPGLLVVGEARNGRDAVALVERLRPDVVLMDLHLPVMNGIEAIERIMAARPTPILVYSAFVDGADRVNATAAFAAGAVEVMEKPGAAGPGRLDADAEDLRRRLRLVGRVTVITHPRARLGGAPATLSTTRLQPAPTRQPSAPTERGDATARVVAGVTARTVRLIGIGASTGGPHALARLLVEFPADMGAAVVVVQHMADGFIDGLASWLDGLAAVPVAVAVAGARLEPGTVSIAPSGLNLTVGKDLRLSVEPPPLTQYHVPGIDATFTSIADAVGADAVGVLLTGMGRDGAAGLRRMRDCGALTIAQDEATSAVYGMPAAAVELDAVDRQLSLDDISDVLRGLAVARPPAGTEPRS